MASRPDPELPDGFLKIAQWLIPQGRKPAQAQLRRSVSSSYYAMFHALARMCADCLVGTQPSKRSNKAWVEVYRGLAHGACLDACKRASNISFPPEIKSFTDAFQQLLRERERADYDPTARFSREDALKTLGLAEEAVAALKIVAMLDRRAFAAWVLITSPGAQKARKQA